MNQHSEHLKICSVRELEEQRLVHVLCQGRKAVSRGRARECPPSSGEAYVPQF